MPLNIRSPEAERLARELAFTTGETLVEAVTQALRERLQRERGRVDPSPVLEQIRQIRGRCAALAVLDRRSPDEILGFGEKGVPR